MKVGVAHASPGVAGALERMLRPVAGCRVAWTATNGDEALTRCDRDTPDVVLLQVALPGLDLIDVTRRISGNGRVAVVLLTDPGLAQEGVVFGAMGAGAIDQVPEPRIDERGVLAGGDEIVRRVRRAARLVPDAPGRAEPTGTDRRGVEPRGAGGMAAPAARPKGRPDLPALVAIGASTGGPAALAAVLGALPAAFPAAVVVAQHVDAQFSTNMAAWLGSLVKLPVRVAQPGDRPEAGVILLAGTNDDLAVTGALDLRNLRPEDGSFYHPSADVLFGSLADYWPATGIAALLTGMGRDGAKGLLALRRRGWHTIAQDQGTSAVYGMPRAAAEIGAAVEVLPLDEIGPTIIRVVTASVTPDK